MCFARVGPEQLDNCRHALLRFKYAGYNYGDGGDQGKDDNDDDDDDPASFIPVL